jgi:hypothetical protein
MSPWSISPVTLTRVLEGLLKQVLSAQSLPEDEKKLITRTIDALVRNAKTRHAYAS